MVLLLLIKIKKLKDLLKNHKFISVIKSMLAYIFSTHQLLIESKIDQHQSREKFSQKWLMKVKFSKWYYQDIGWILDSHKIIYQDKHYI